MSIGGLLNVSKDAMLSYQLALDVTGGNISNVNTPGYTRQRPLLTASGTVNAKAASAQLSVRVERIDRMFDAFTEMQIAEQSQKAGAADAKNDMLKRVETVLDETQGGKLNDAMNRFWSAWEDLAGNPSGKVERDALVSAAQEMTGIFNSYGEQLFDLQRSANDAIKDTLAEIDVYAGELASLNRQIGQISDASGEANRLLDERNAIVKRLSGLINCQCIEGPNHSLNIYLTNGKPLVEGEMSNRLALKKNSGAFFPDIVYSPTGESVTPFLSPEKGKLGSLLDIRDRAIPEYLARLDDMAGTIMNKVNDIHRQGFDAKRNLGGNFFVLIPKDALSHARYLAIDSKIVADSGRIAASATVAGDGKQAAAIAALRNELLMNDGQATLGAFYASLIGRVAREVAEASRNSEYQSNVLVQLTNQREGISGVSVDEEMMNLIRYQMGYNAAGKLCQVVDRMMETLMGMVR
ncbi:MAG: flagellar hook-associated protein FlgK [Pseudomonadota bacterium]|nr:flagellar hook-associated protein FlgK [Pseudomonadota bacterium]